MENQFLDNVEQTRETRKLFSRIGLSLFVMVSIVQVIQTIVYKLAEATAPNLLGEPWMPWAMIAVGFYITAFPVYCILMKKIPSVDKGEPKHLHVSKIVVMFFICMATMYLFNYLSLAINYIIGLLKGGTVINPIGEAIASSNMIYTFLFAGVIAPIIEEIVFRGILIDKIRCYGDKTAIWVSALAFGLFHLNLSQFFYATALGILLAYIAIRTNQIKYTIILHMCINIMGSVVAPAMIASENPILMGVAGLMVLFILAVGIILFMKEKKHVIIEEGTQLIEPAVRKRTIYGNAGMICFLLLCFVFIVITTMA